MPGKKLKWEPKAEERPGELLQAALSLFSRMGYRGTPLELVAEEAGVSKGTIYRYFQNKEDLLEKALEIRVRQTIQENTEALEDFEGTPAERLRFLLQRFWTRTQNPEWGPFMRLMFSEIATELPALFRKWLQNGTVQGWKLMEGVIRQGQESEYLKEQNPKVRVIAGDPIGSLYTHYHRSRTMGEGHPYKVEGIGGDKIPTTLWFD